MPKKSCVRLFFFCNCCALFFQVPSLTMGAKLSMLLQSLSFPSLHSRDSQYFKTLQIPSLWHSGKLKTNMSRKRMVSVKFMGSKLICISSTLQYCGHLTSKSSHYMPEAIIKMFWNFDIRIY